MSRAEDFRVDGMEAVKKVMRRRVVEEELVLIKLFCC